MLIPKVTPTQLRTQPDQFCKVINDLITAVNALQKKA